MSDPSDRKAGGGVTQPVNWFPVAEENSLPEREGRKVVFQGFEIALFSLGGGEYRAIENRCPHKQGPLADGIVSGKSVFCPLHGLNLNLENGCAIKGSGQVKVYPVRVIDGQVCVAVYEGRYCGEGLQGEFAMDERI